MALRNFRTVVTPIDTPATTINTVIWLPEDRFVAGASVSASDDTIIYSDDGGLTWTAVTCAIDNSVLGLAYSSSLGRIVAVGNADNGTDIIATSDDSGETWTAQTDPYSGAIGRSVAWSPTLEIFVMVATGDSAGKVIASSPNGIAWTHRTSAFEAGALDGLGFAVRWIDGPAQFIASGRELIDASATLTFSDDGTTWDAADYITFPDYDAIMRDALWDGTQFVAAVEESTAFPTAGDDGIATAPTWDTWTKVSTPLGDVGAIGDCWGIAQANDGTLIAVGNTSGGALNIIEDDGSGWVANTSVQSALGALRGIAYSTIRDKFVVVGQGTTGSGPLVGIEREGPTLYQRIYGIPVEIDDNGVETVRELLVGVVGAAP